MSAHDIAMACKKAIESECNPGHRVSLVLPRKSPPRGERVRLAGSGSPLGEVLCWNSHDAVVAQFDAIEVLAWLAAHGLVEVVAEVRR